MEEGDIEPESQQQQHEPLFKLLSDTCTEEGAKAPNPKYEDGKTLPKKLRNRFLEEAKPCVPLEEIDPYFRNKQTFIVIGRWGTLHRFSCNGGWILHPNNPLRRFAIYLITNWIFATFIVATLLLNIVALAKTQSYEISMNFQTKRSWLVDAMYIVDYVCLAIYLVELILKVLARGLAGDAFTSFRDPWTWLDVVVIWTGFFNFSFILDRRSARWLRLFKLIPLIPSIRQAGKLSVKAVKRLGGILILAVLFLWFFSLLGTQLYMGTLTQKCVKQVQGDVSPEAWDRHARNATNWFYDQYGEVFICGNSTGAGQCPENYVCLQGFGKNPDFGYTNFDDVLWSLLSVLRISTDDFTEMIFRQVLGANGPWHLLFFEALFLFITYPIGCMFFGLLANFFKESRAPAELEMEDLTGLAELHDFDHGQNPETLAITGKSLDAPEELAGFRKSLHSFVYHEWIRRILIVVILIDVYSIVRYNLRYFHEDDTFSYYVFIRIIPYAVFFLYTVEFLLKIIALGPANYYKDRWNHVDFVVLLTFFLEIHSYFGSFGGYMLAPIRMIKLIQYWPSLRMIFAVYYKTIKSLWGWVLYTAIMCAFFVFIGPFEIGKYERESNRFDVKAGDLPRWSFIDFWHSFRMIVRAQIAEWIETLWDVLQYTSNSLLYYLAINCIGALLISFLLIGIVYTSLNELKTNYDPSKDTGLRLLLRKTVGLLYFPIQRIQPGELIMKNGSENGAENGAEENGSKSKEGKGNEGGRRKQSIIAESTGQLRKVMQDCTEHWAYKVATSAVIAIASIAMIYETKDASDDLQTALFVIEIVFTVIFFVIAIYELVSYGFRESIMNRGWVFDALIVLENILNLTIYQFSVSGPFLTGVFCIRAFRPLMLIARLDCIKAAFRGLKTEIKMVWETILAIFFIWLFFDTFGVHWLAGMFYKCINPEDGEEKKYNKIECLSRNMSWENSEYNFDDSGTGFINMVFLVSRMGWVSIINDGSDAVGLDAPRQKDVSKFWLFYFILFVLVGGLGAMGVLFSYVFKRFQDDKGYTLIVTEDQDDEYKETKNRRDPKENGIVLEDEYIPCPEAPCLQALYNFVTNQKFDAVVMGLILFDNICMSLDHYSIDETWAAVLLLVGFIVLVLYVGEMIVKMVAWGKHYFRNAWNYLDLIVILTSVISLILSDIFPVYFLRMLRLLRIFRFLLAKNCGLKAAKVLFNSVYNSRHALGNLILLHLTVMWAYALLGNYLWANVVYFGGMLNDQINFTTFRHAFWVLALLLGFPGIDGLYSALGNETDCVVKDPETSTCGDRTGAILYIGSYVAVTFLVLLNMYAVLISEIISELGRYNGDAKNDPDQDVPLENVTTENGGASNGDVGDGAEDVEENSDVGE